MLIPTRFRVICAIAYSALALIAIVRMGGCVDKMGTSMDVNEASPVSIKDPSNTHSAAVIGQDTTSTHGPLVTETSKLNDEGMWETNSGGAAKQRLSIVVLPDGTIRAGGSAASDLDIGEITSTWTPNEDGSMARSLTFKQVRTNNTSVQKAVNEGVIALVQQWMTATEAERAVLEKQLDTQARLGDAAAQTFQAMLPMLKALAGLP